MSFIVFKINHPWWHFFFTEWKHTQIAEERSYVCFFCSKCNARFTVTDEY